MWTLLVERDAPRDAANWRTLLAEPWRQRDGRHRRWRRRLATDCHRRRYGIPLPRPEPRHLSGLGHPCGDRRPLTRPTAALAATVYLASYGLIGIRLWQY